VDAFHDGEEVRFRRVDNVLGDAATPGLAARLLGEEEELMMLSTEEPATFAAAEHKPEWRRAMLEEMRQIEANRTWDLVDPPAGCRLVGLKWVYKVKKDEHAAVVKHKARLVARGFVQREGIDFEEVFAPVARMESVRLVLAMAAAKDWAVHHLDVKSVFLNDDLTEEVFVKQAPGFIVKGPSTRCSASGRRSTACGRRRGRGTPSSTPPMRSSGSHGAQQSTPCTPADGGRKNSSSGCTWTT
jgi:hypothetical protein